MYVCRPNATIRVVLSALESTRGFCQIVVDDKGIVLGTITDGDIRRALLRGVNLEGTAESCMRRNPIVCSDARTAEGVLAANSVDFVPIVDIDERLTSIACREKPFIESRMPPVVIMAGGFGKRLSTMTEGKPKSLVEVSGRPILDHILERVEEQGVTEVFISTHYLADQIDAFIRNRKNRCKICTLHENEPLGTAGCLSLLPTSVRNGVFLINGDVLCQASLAAMEHFHFTQGHQATVAAATYEHQIPFGVIRYDENGRMHHVDEKPVVRHLVSAGIYRLDQDIINLVPDDVSIDITTVLDMARQQNISLGVFPMHEYWKDIGSPAQLEAARLDLP